jgi:hypothetical protein
LDVGSGLIAGGADATEALAETLHDLDHNNPTAANLFKLAQSAHNMAAGRMQHNTSHESVTVEELKKRYKSARRLTSNVIFGSGDGMLGEYARDEAICRRQNRIEKMDAAIQKKKQDLTDALVAYQKLKSDMLKPNFKWTIDRLKIAIKVKTLPGDKARPTTKEALLERYNKIKRRSTPQSSPACSDDEGSVNERSNIEDDDGNVDLVFGDGDTSLESSDNVLENDESMMEAEEMDNE